MVEAKGLNPKDQNRIPVGYFPLYAPLPPDIAHTFLSYLH
jgi:hypothetical protein